MPFPLFKDIDSSVSDIINDDFDSKFTLKIKSAGPNSTTITTNTQYIDKDNKQALKPKVSVKWPHASGFTLEKLEFSPECKMTVETSLSGAAPGLKIEFKGNDGEKADLSCNYSLPAASMTAGLDINNFAAADFSVSSGTGPLVGGAAIKLTSTKDESNKMKVDVDLGLAHTVPGICFASLRAKENLSKYSLLFSYTHIKDLVLAGNVDYSAKAIAGTVLAAYKVDPLTTVKAKATSSGIFSASIKKSFEKKFAVVASAEVPSSFNSIKWGVNATLG